MFRRQTLKRLYNQQRGKAALLVVAAVGAAAVWLPSPVVAHPADITVTDFFVEQDWENTELAANQMRAVHSLNWFEAMDILDPNVTAATMLADLTQYHATVTAYLSDNLVVLNNGELCAFENIYIPPQAAGEVTTVGLFFDFDVVCPTAITDVSVTANFLLEKYPEQSNYLTFYRFPGELIVTDSVNPERPTATHQLASTTENGTESTPRLFTTNNSWYLVISIVAILVAAYSGSRWFLVRNKQQADQ